MCGLSIYYVAEASIFIGHYQYVKEGYGSIFSCSSQVNWICWSMEVMSSRKALLCDDSMMVNVLNKSFPEVRRVWSCTYWFFFKVLHIQVGNYWADRREFKAKKKPYSVSKDGTSFCSSLLHVSIPLRFTFSNNCLNWSAFSSGLAISGFSWCCKLRVRSSEVVWTCCSFWRVIVSTETSMCELICPSPSMEEFVSPSLITSSVLSPLFYFGANIEGTKFAAAILVSHSSLIFIELANMKWNRNKFSLTYLIYCLWIECKGWHWHFVNKFYLQQQRKGLINPSFNVMSFIVQLVDLQNGVFGIHGCIQIRHCNNITIWE